MTKGISVPGKIQEYFENWKNEPKTLNITKKCHPQDIRRPLK